ncbi:MAG: DUF721 domain-containing protein [Deltaproteobacteria bacterium]|nr:DUF721 domain-containing protein [Deltaproteobacteria bacterium]
MHERNGNGGRPARDPDDVPRERRGGPAQRVGSDLRRMLEELFRRPRAERALEVTAAWSRAVGPRVAQVARPVRIVDRKLVVQVTSPTWRNELQLRAAEILRKLRRELGDAVQALELRIGVNQDLREAGAPAAGTAREALPALRSVAASLETPELRELALALAEGRPAPDPRRASRRDAKTRKPRAKARG